MGDMKTPDFDDLLAAFDIPDATGLDAKEPIHGSHEGAESQLKQSGMCLDDNLLSPDAVHTADIPAVSVIVKNTSRQESFDGFDDGLHSGSPLQNGFSGQENSIYTSETTTSGFSKSLVSTLNGASSGELPGEAPIQHKPDGAPILFQSMSHFSPVSSPECKDIQSNTEEMHPKQSKPCFPEASALVEPSVDETQNKIDNMFDKCPDDSFMPKNTNLSLGEFKVNKNNVNNKTEETPREHSRLSSPNSNQNSTETNCTSGTMMDAPTSYPHTKSQTSKFSSCLNALVAMNARKDPSEPSIPRESHAVQSDCMKASPKVPISPRSPRSPLEAVKRFMKPSDSPVSIYSDSSGKASPAVASGSPPAIPRVRIKTIKTTCGRIQRTVTSVLPDSETDEIHSAYESSPSQSIISDDSYWTVSPRQSQTVDGNVGSQNKSNPSSASSSKGLHRKSEERAARSSVTPPRTVFHKSGGPVKRAVDKQKPKRVSATTGPPTTTNFLPKAMHLASLNLVPHSVAASVAARSASQQPSQHSLPPTLYSGVPLVHQVKTSASHPQTSGQSSGAGTLNRLLHQTNPVPTYVPNLTPPPESNLNLPPHGYRCLECGDSFAVERSLTFHCNRRSVHIEVRCAHCAQTMVFFNKCALWAHAREHKNNGVMMQCTHLRVSPISEEQMSVPSTTKPVTVGSFSSPLPSTNTEAALPLDKDGVNRLPRSCPECNQQLADDKALAGHFQRFSGNVEKLICKICSMLLPNKCSFKAHLRLHEHKSPYCCPECGAESRSADIQKHVKENCLHYARKAWYKCLHCDTVFKTLQSQKSHIEENHCELLHRCNICTSVFKSFDSCEQHMKNRHRVRIATPKLMFRCSCGTIFKKKQSLLEHFSQSVNKRLSSVFKCPECNSVFSQKQLLMKHFKGVHVGNVSTEREKNREERKKNVRKQQDLHSVHQQKSRVKHAESSRKKPELHARPHVRLTCWTCGECLLRFPDRDSYVAHMKENHRKQSKKKFPCRYCEKTFKSTTSMRRHVRSEHRGNKRTYTCWYCTDTKKTFPTSVTLKNHISLMHGIKNPDLDHMPKTFIQEHKKTFKKGLRSAPPAVGTQQAQAPDLAAGLEASSAKRAKVQFRCSKCGFITDDGARFQQHIPQHKTDENTPQCLHCGLCFTSVLSLNRHRFIVHRVKGPEDAKPAQEEKGADIRERALDSRPAEDHVANVAPSSVKETEPPQEEAENVQSPTTTECNLKLRC